MAAVTPPRSVLIMHFGKRRTWTVLLANSLAAVNIETTLLVLGPISWMQPRGVPLDRAARVEFLVDYEQSHRWTNWRPKLYKTVRRGRHLRRFGTAGGLVRRGSRVGEEALEWADLTLRPQVLANSAMHCLRENSIINADAVVAADSLSLLAADRWGRLYPDRPVVVGRDAERVRRYLGIQVESQCV